MKVLLVCYFPHNSGGTGISTYELARGLRSLGISVVIASTQEYPGFKTYIFRKVRYIPVFLLRNLYLYIVFNSIIKAEKITIIHCSDSRFSAVGCVRAAQKNMIKCVLHHRDYWFCCLKGDLLYKNKELCRGMNWKKCSKCTLKFKRTWQLYKYWNFKKRINIYNLADWNIAISNTVQKKLIEFGIKHQVKKIFNPIESYYVDKSKNKLDIYKKNGRVIVGFAGKLIYHRGVEYLLKTIKEVSINTNIIFLIAGRGEMEAEIKYFIKLHKLKNVSLLGELEYTQMPDFFNTCNIFFFPSLIPEPFGRVVVEAMAYRCVPIASEYGALKEIITDGENGFLVNPRNFHQCAERINLLGNNSNLRETMAKLANHKAQEFKGINSAKRVYKLYKN